MPTDDASTPMRATIWQYTLFAKIEYGDSIDEDKSTAERNAYMHEESPSFIFLFSFIISLSDTDERTKDTREKTKLSPVVCVVSFYI